MSDLLVHGGLESVSSVLEVLLRKGQLACPRPTDTNAEENVWPTTHSLSNLLGRARRCHESLHCRLLRGGQRHLGGLAGSSLMDCGVFIAVEGDRKGCTAVCTTLSARSVPGGSWEVLLVPHRAGRDLRAAY